MPRRRQVLQALGAGTATVLGGCLASAPSATFAFDPLAATDLQEHASAQLQGGLRNRGYVETPIPTTVTLDWSLPVNRGAHTAAKASPDRCTDRRGLTRSSGAVRRRHRPAATACARSTADSRASRRGE